MFVEILHVNEPYGEHDAQLAIRNHPRYTEVIAKLQGVIRQVVDSGGDVLYLPNLGGSRWPLKVLESGMHRDTLLKGLASRYRDAVQVRADGLEVSGAYRKETAKIENELAVKHRKGFVVGAYTSMCVLAKARDLKRRGNLFQVMIDPQLCLEWSGQSIQQMHGSIPLTGLGPYFK